MTEQNTSTGVNVRLLALETLLEAGRGDRQSHLLIRDVLDKYAWLPERDRAFYTRLCEGTLEYRLQLDYIIDQFSSTPVKKMKPVIREILRLSVYQMLYMNSVPDSAAVNEGVRMAGKKGFRTLKGFVNGVLRNIAREKNQINWPMPEGSPRNLSVRYSVPQWLTERWIRDYGTEKARIICASFPGDHPVTARLRAGSAFDESLYEKAPYVSDAVILREVRSLRELPAFLSGELIIQDVSSMLAVQAAGIRPGDRILDICAAPGGKSLYAADLTGKDGSVTARDLTETKCALILENIRRCGLENVCVEQTDAAVYRPEDEGRYDVVLADLPCSGYGVIGKKPDIRYHASEERERQLEDLQRQILLNAVRYVRPGGTLLYSTCTFHSAENEDQVRWMCRDLPQLIPGLKMVPDDLRPYLPEELADEETAADGYLQLLPGVHQCDGFFFARLRRSE